MAYSREVFRIDGLKELDEALVGLAEEFAVRNARNVLRGALRDGGEIIARAGKSLAPRSGHSGEGRALADSYSVGGKLNPRQRRMLVKESAIEIYVGPAPSAKAIQTEFGNSHQSPQPHMRPAWDQNWARVLQLIIDRTAERLEATRKRLAKKAEREAQQMNR